MASDVETKLPDIEEIEYPSSDDEPLAETTIHLQTIIWLFEALQDLYRRAADVFVASNLFWYFEKGNPAARRTPDVMVVKGVPRGDRRSYFSWREKNPAPNVIFEITSEKTWREDLYVKSVLFAALGVREYILFDPEYTHLDPALMGFRRNDRGEFVRLELDAEGRLWSEELQVYLRPEGIMLRLTPRSSGQPLLTREEQAVHAQQFGEQERQRADQERQRAEQERQRGEQERQRANQLEAEVARLRALLEQTKPGSTGST